VTTYTRHDAYRANVALALAALEDAMEYVRSHPEDQFDNSITEASALTTDVPLRHLLGALAHIRDDDGRARTADLEIAHWLVADVYSSMTDDEKCLTEIIAFAAEFSESTVLELLGSEDMQRYERNWQREVVLSSLPGLFTKAVYDALGLRPVHARSTYLQRQLRIQRTGLTKRQDAVAEALSEEWVGTFPLLIDTTRRLDTGS
jgi:hypothetical protein